jgi:hypothetical protein
VVGVTISPWATRVEAASIAHTNVMRSNAGGCTFEFAWHAPASQRSWLAHCLLVSQVAVPMVMSDATLLAGGGDVAIDFCHLTRRGIW